MTYRDAILQSSEKISTLFQTKNKKKSLKKQENLYQQRIIRLNFFLRELCIHGSKKEEKKKTYTFSYPKKEKNKNSLLLNKVEQAEDHFLKEHSIILSFRRAPFYRNPVMKKIIQWRLIDYLHTLKELEALLTRKRDISPYILKYHLITFIKQKMQFDAHLSAKEVQEELRRQQARWELWAHHVDGGASRVSPV